MLRALHFSARVVSYDKRMRRVRETPESGMEAREAPWKVQPHGETPAKAQYTVDSPYRTLCR